MIDLALDADDVDGADAAFAAAAVGNHLVPGLVEDVEHRAVVRDHEFDVGVHQPHPEGFGRQQAAGAEGFVGKIGKRPAGGEEGMARGIEHAHRTAE